MCHKKKDFLKSNHLGVATSGEEVDEQDDEGDDEPGGGHGPDDPEAL